MIGTIKYLRLECKRIGRGDPIGDSWPKRLPASRPNYRGQLDDSPDHDVDDGDDDEHYYAHDDDDDYEHRRCSRSRNSLRRNHPSIQSTPTFCILRCYLQL